MRPPHVKRRRVRVGLVAVLIVVTVLLGSGIHLLHAYQVRRNSAAFIELANQAEKEGDLAKSADYLRRYIALNPDDIEQLARLELMRADLAETPRAKLQATFRLAAVLRKAPDRLDVRRKRAELLLEIGRYADALEQLQHLLEVMPDDPELYRMLARAHAGRADFPAAVLAYRKAIELEPDDFDSYERLIGILRDRLEQPDEAEKAVSEMLTRHPEHPRALVVAARHHQAVGELDEARALVERGLKIAPDDAELLKTGASVAIAQEDYDAALEYARRAIEHEPTDPAPYVLAAQVLATREDLEGAIATLRRGLDATDRDPTVLVTLAEYLATSGREEEASRLIQRVEDKSLAAEYRELIQGLLALRRNAVLEAAEHLEQAVVRAAGLPSLQVRALYYSAQAYRLMGLLDLAAQNIQTAINMQRQAAYLRWAAAELYAAQGQLDSALSEARLAARLGKLRPEHAALLLRLHVLGQLSRPEPARTWAVVDRVAEQLRERFSDSPPFTAAYADYLRVRGRATEALEVLDEAIKKHPDELSLYVALAEHYRRWNLPDKALETLDRGREACGDAVALRLARLRIISTDEKQLRSELEKAAQRLEAFEPIERSQLLRTLGLLYFRLGDTQRARQLLERASRLAEHDLGTRVLLFDLALQDKDVATLRKVVNEMRRIEARSVFGREGAIWKYGQALVLILEAGEPPDENRLRQARLLLEQARNERPRWHKPHALLGRLYELSGETNLATEAYVTAVRLGDRSAGTIAGAVRLLIQQGETRQADELLRGLHAEQAIPPEVDLTASTVFARSQNLEAALELASRHLQRNPDDPIARIWYARLVEANGHVEEAEEHFRKASELAPDNPQIWVALVAYYARNNRKEEAERVVEREIPKHLTGDALAACRSACYELLGDLEKAKKSWEELLTQYSSNAAVLAAAAEFHIRNGEYDEAENLLRKAIQLLQDETPSTKDDSEPQNADELLRAYRRRLAALLATRGGYARWQEAYRLIEQNLSDAPDSRDDQRVKAMLLASRNSARMQREAIRIFENLLSERTISDHERFLLGRLYYRYGQASRGREQILRVLAENPDNAFFIAGYARLLLDRGELTDAENWIGRLEELQPDRFRTAELRVRLLHAQGKDDDALEVLERLEQKYMGDEENGPNTVGLALVGRLYELIGHSEAAGRMYRNVAKRVPEGLLLVAQWLADQGQIEKAMQVLEECWKKLPPERAALGATRLARHPAIRPEHLAKLNQQVQEAITKAPNSVELRLAAALLKDVEKDYRTAADLYREVLMIDKGNVVALNNLAWLLSEYFDQPDTALKLIDQAIERIGPAPELLDTKGVVLLRLGRIEGPGGALELLEEAYQTAPAAHIGYHLAMAYNEVGRYADARLLLERLGPPEEVISDLHGTEVAAYQKLLASLNVKPGRNAEDERER